MLKAKTNLITLAKTTCKILVRNEVFVNLIKNNRVITMDMFYFAMDNDLGIWDALEELLFKALLRINENSLLEFIINHNEYEVDVKNFDFFYDFCKLVECAMECEAVVCTQ